MSLEDGAGLAESLDCVPPPAITIRAIEKSWHDNIYPSAVP